MADPQDSKKFIPSQQYFQGGMTVDYKMGIANSYYSSHNLDPRTFPSQMSVLPASRQIAGNLKDLILDVQQDLSGNRWAVGSKGYFYKIDASNNVSIIDQLNEDGSAGLLYSQITDQLYMPGQSAVSLYGQVTSTATGQPVIRKDLWDASASSALGCVSLFNSASGYFDGGAGYRNNIVSDSLDVTSGITLSNYSTLVTNTLTNTYNLPSTIIENDTNFCYFAPDIEPLYSVAVYVDAIGTGNWTLTMHDSLNNELASVEITNADMTTGWNNFVFGKQVRAYVNASNVGYSPTYHFHLTSSVQNDTAKVYTYNANDLSGANMVVFAYRLVETNNKWHPTDYFTGTGSPLLCIGNGEYLATYNFGNDSNPSSQQFRRHTLTFRPGEEVCGLTTNYGYLVIGTERRSTNSDRKEQVGRLYFWDGSTTAPAFYIDMPMGSPYSLYSFNNVTYFACSGSLYAWSGGQTVLKVRKLAYQNTDYMGAVDQTRSNPRSFTSRYNIMLMAYPSFTTDPNIDYGIWSWGGVEMIYPNSFIYSYSLSMTDYDSETETYTNLNYSTANNLNTGCCVNFYDTTYTSWQYTDSNSVTHYGLDVIDNFSNPGTFANWDSLIFDGGVVYKEKMAVRYKIYFEALPAGWTLTPYWTIDRGTKEYGSAVTTGATEAFVEWNNARFHELQWGFQLVNDGTATSPAVILGISPEIDPNNSEGDLIPNEA